MNITRDQWIQIGKVMLVAVLAILAVFGYDLGVIQPRYADIVKTAPEPVISQGLGFIQFQNMRVNGQSAFVGAESHAGAATFVTVTTTSLISQSVGFNATGSSAFLTTTLNGPVTLSGTAALVGATTATGATALNGGLTMDTSAFSVADTTGNTVVSGTLNITSTLSQGGVSFTGPLKYGTAATYASGARIAHGFATTPTMCMLWPAEITATLTITTTGFSSDTAVHSTPIMWMCGK
jgi:hypothetical protein